MTHVELTGSAYLTLHTEAQNAKPNTSIYAMAAAEIAFAFVGHAPTEAQVQGMASVMNSELFGYGLEAALGVLTPAQLKGYVVLETLTGPSTPQMAQPMPQPTTEECEWTAALVGVPGVFSALLGFGG